MHQEVVAVPLQIVTNEFEVVAVGDVADSLGEERLVGLDLFQADRALLARDLGDASQFVDQLMRRQPAHREGEFGTERQAVDECAERKADHGGGNRSAEDDDHRMFTDEQAQIATEQHHRCDNEYTANEPNARHDIHSELQRARKRPAILDGGAAHLEPRALTLRGSPLKTGYRIR